jgi:hypothetical protein
MGAATVWQGCWVDDSWTGSAPALPRATRSSPVLGGLLRITQRGPRGPRWVLPKDEKPCYLGEHYESSMRIEAGGQARTEGRCR